MPHRLPPVNAPAVPRIARGAVSATAHDRVRLERSIYRLRLTQLFAGITLFGAVLGATVAATIAPPAVAGGFLLAAATSAAGLTLARVRIEGSVVLSLTSSIAVVALGTLGLPHQGLPLLYLAIPATLAVMVFERQALRFGSVVGLLLVMVAIGAAHHLLHAAPFDAAQLFHSVVIYVLLTGFAELHRERRARDIALWARSTRTNQRLADRAMRSARAAQLAHDQSAAVLARISHELRTPLNAILGYAELLEEDEDLSADGRADVARIQASGAHLLALVDDLLELDGLDRAAVLSCDDIDLRAFLDGLAAATRPLANTQANEIVVQVTGAEQACLDAHRVGRILSQLLVNAARFTENGRIDLKAHAERGLVRFIVEDQGCGIAAERLPHLFEPFMQGDAARFHGGAGLGLTLVDRTVRQLGGHIEVRSEVGRGTRFLVAVPRSDATQHGLTPVGAEFPSRP